MKYVILSVAGTIIWFLATYLDIFWPAQGFIGLLIVCQVFLLLAGVIGSKSSLSEAWGAARWDEAILIAAWFLAFSVGNPEVWGWVATSVGLAVAWAGEAFFRGAHVSAR